MTIVTSFQYPPIPVRDFDWLAYFDGQEEGPQGWGRTKDAAIADLIENFPDEYEEMEAEDARKREREADALHNGGLSPLGNALAELSLSKAGA